MRVSRNETDFLFPANLGILREARALDFSLEDGAGVEGLLEDREGLCLYVLARRCARIGNIVEIGSWKGRSTWFLARGLEDAGSPHRVVAIDPHLEGTREDFEATIARAGIAARVDSRITYSHEVAPSFDEPVGLLWIDGDHSYDAVRRDFDDWFPRLAVGGWIAFHDTVNHWYGPTRLVRELLAHRDDLERVGVIGTITFARRCAPRRLNRVRLWLARAAFEAVTLLREMRMGRGPVNAAPGER